MRLLECDEIKSSTRSKRASAHAGAVGLVRQRDAGRAQPTPDAEHAVGPLPSRRAVSALPLAHSFRGASRPASASAALAATVELPDSLFFTEGLALAAVSAPQAGGETRASCLASGSDLRSCWARATAQYPSAETRAPVGTSARVAAQLDAPDSGRVLTRGALGCLLADGRILPREGHELRRFLSWPVPSVAGRPGTLATRACHRAGGRRAARGCFVQRATNAGCCDRLARVHSEGWALSIRLGSHRSRVSGWAMMRRFCARTEADMPSAASRHGASIDHDQRARPARSDPHDSAAGDESCSIDRVLCGRTVGCAGTRAPPPGPTPSREPASESQAEQRCFMRCPLRSVGLAEHSRDTAWLDVCSAPYGEREERRARVSELRVSNRRPQSGDEADAHECPSVATDGGGAATPPSRNDLPHCSARSDEGQGYWRAL